jgi:hypothetical protein
LLSLVTEDLGDESVFSNGKIDVPLLLLGLIFREVSRSMQIEPGAESDLPQHLVDSPFGIQEMNRIEKMLDSVAFSED